MKNSNNNAKMRSEGRKNKKKGNSKKNQKKRENYNLKTNKSGEGMRRKKEEKVKKKYLNKLNLNFTVLQKNNNPNLQIKLIFLRKIARKSFSNNFLKITYKIINQSIAHYPTKQGSKTKILILFPNVNFMTIIIVSCCTRIENSMRM